MIRFYGTHDSIERWIEVVESITDKKCSAPKVDSAIISTCEVDLTMEDRVELLNEAWYETDKGSDLMWNRRVSFLEV